MAAKRYADGTKVEVDKTLLEIRALLTKRGAKEIEVRYSGRQGAILCHVSNRILKFSVSLESARGDEAELRRRWRCMLMTIKGRFIEIEEGMGVFDEVFLANIVVNAEEQTVYEVWKAELPPAKAIPALAGGKQ